jgi:hypothetical protein
VARGLEGYVFAPPSTPVQISNAGEGFGPRPVLIQRFGPLEMRSTDGQLHNAVATNAEGERLFNVPLLPHGAPRTVRFEAAHGLVSLTCAVHEPEGEAPARLLVLGHPFWTVAGADGRFSLEEVPPVDLTLAADHTSGVDARVELDP